MLSARHRSPGFLGTTPEQARVSPFRGPRDTLEAMARIALGPRGEQSLLVRQFTETVTREVWPKDYNGEILAIRNVFLQPSPTDPNRRLFRYMNDPRHVEWIKDPQRQVEEIQEHGSTTVDCLPESTLVLTRDQVIPLQGVVPGTEIWGLDGWTRVKALAYKDVLTVSGARMSNGSVVRSTKKHPFMVELCEKHDEDWARPSPCECESRRRVKLPFSDLQPEMVVTSPRPQALRVKELFHDVAEVACYDLETESGYVYLPEHDVTVHNCDEIALMGAVMALQLGREVEFVALGFAPGQLTHVGFRVKEPKSNRWIWVDPVAGPREREAAATAKEMLRWSLD